MDGREGHVCPVVDDRAMCAWPGRLVLDLDDSGGRFRLTIVTERETFITLPGSRTRWPLDVRTQNGPLVVLERDELPVAKLGRGSHEVEGRFQWLRLPETLTIPSQLALVDLQLNRQPVAQLTRDEGLLWLAGAPRQADDQERLELEVFRRIEDGVPLLVTTLIRLTVSGRAREVSLKPLWLSGAIPLGVQAVLPVRVDGDGSVAAQVFAGKHEIVLYEAHPDSQDELSSPALGPPWPEAEIWSLLPRDALRQLRLVGAPAADPARVNVPAAWSALAAYRVSPNTKVALVTERRGDPNPAPNRIAIQRDIWLDLDGTGYTVRDQMSGKLSQNWRLDLLVGELGQAQLDGQPQLITRHPSTATPGVELRNGDVHLTADWRLDERRRELPAVGWSENADTLTTQLHLPPGWWLLGASGVDSLGNTWLASWDLLALFFVLIVALSAARLTHPAVGALALLTLVLLHDQEDAPRGLWLAVLAAIALLRVVPRGKARQLIRLAGFTCGAGLAFVVVSFAVEQMRTALFPQTQRGGGTVEMASRSDEAWPELPVSDLRKEYGVGSTDVARKQKTTSFGGTSSQQDPKAVIQTGPGIPDWRWESWTLTWSGPVHKDHTFRLYLISPVINGVLSLIRVGLTGLLTYLLLQLLFRQAAHAPPSRTSPRHRGISAAATVVFACLLHAEKAQAEFPPETLLDELRTRMVAPAICEPNCVTVQRARVEMTDAGLFLGLEVHAEALSSVRLPGPDKDWAPADVRVDGAPAAGMMRAPDGFWHLRVQAGIHRVELRGPVTRDDITLNLGTPPHYVEVHAPGWEISGVNELQQVDMALSLHRKGQTETVGQSRSSRTLSGWLRVHRKLTFEKTWSVSTVIERVGGEDWKADGAVSVRIPLLDGERVTTADVPVEKQAVVLTLERGTNSYQFQSTLEQRETVSLIAASTAKLAEQRFNEQWTVDCSPIWHCEIEGLAPISRHAEGRWEPTFVPWPGERIDIHLSRPDPAEGVSTTIDGAELTLTPGVRLLKARLLARARTTSQYGLKVQLPSESELSEVSINGVAQALQVEDDIVTLQLPPGQHVVEVAWQQAGGVRTLFRPETVNLGQEIVNAKVKIELPVHRWLLLAGGSGWGPAVLFWGYLALILLLAPVLARVPQSPLTTRQWVILGLGFTQVPILVAGLVVGWFFLFAHADRLRPRSPWGHNLFQLSAVFATGVFVTCLFGAVYDGLLSTPEMKVLGAGSSSRELIWYSDRTDGSLPRPWVLTTSLWVWRFAMLSWAMWLASRLLAWLRWGWDAFSRRGIWRATSNHRSKRPPPSVASWDDPNPPDWSATQARDIEREPESIKTPIERPSVNLSATAAASATSLPQQPVDDTPEPPPSGQPAPTDLPDPEAANPDALASDEPKESPPGPKERK